MLIRILPSGSEVQNMHSNTEILGPVDPPPHLRDTAGSRRRIPCFPVAKIAAVGH